MLIGWSSLVLWWVDLTIWVSCIVHLLTWWHLLPISSLTYQILTFRWSIILSVLSREIIRLIIVSLRLGSVNWIWRCSKSSSVTLVGCISFGMRNEVRIVWLAHKWVICILLSCHNNISQVCNSQTSTWWSTINGSVVRCIRRITLETALIIFAIWEIVYWEWFIHIVYDIHVVSMNTLVEHHLVLLILHLNMGLVETELLKQIQLFLLT